MSLAAHGKLLPVPNDPAVYEEEYLEYNKIVGVYYDFKDGDSGKGKGNKGKRTEKSLHVKAVFPSSSGKYEDSVVHCEADNVHKDDLMHLITDHLKENPEKATTGVRTDVAKLVGKPEEEVFPPAQFPLTTKGSRSKAMTKDSKPQCVTPERNVECQAAKKDTAGFVEADVCLRAAEDRLLQECCITPISNY